MRSALSVVHVLAPAPFGGLESVVATLSRGLTAAGDRVVVVAVVEPDEPNHPFVQALRAKDLDVRAVCVHRLAYMAERSAVRRIIREVSADVLHTHGFRPDVADAPVARRLGVPTVTTVHGFAGLTRRSRVYEFLQRRAFRRFDAVVAVSQKLRSELEGVGVPPDRVHVLRNAWSPAGEPLSRSEARDRLGIPEGEIVVGWVGRLSAEKAPELMVEALARSGVAGTKVSMVGAGPMEQQVRGRAAELGLGDRIRWHGVVPEAARHLTAFDAVFLTSWTEGTPMALLEAMAAGVPVVTTAVGGIPDVVSANEAVLVEAGDVDALGRAMDEVAAGGPRLQERAAAARARLAREFASGPWVDRYRELYASLSR